MSTSETSSLLEAVNKLRSSIGKVPARTRPLSYLERILNFLLGILETSAFQTQPTPLQRILSLQLEKLRPYNQGSRSSLQQAVFLGPWLDVERGLSVLLRQSSQTIRTILAKNRLHNRQIERNRNNSGVPSLVYDYCQRFEIAQKDDYLKLVQCDQRSRILITFHFGDFIYGPNSLLRLDRPSRQKFVLSKNRISDACFQNLCNGFGRAAPDRSSELLYAETSSSDLSKLLRRDNATLLLFCDMPAEFNETVVVNFLGREARFSIGPALLAITNNVPLLPIINFFDGKANCLRLGSQLEPAMHCSESLRAAAQRMTRNAVSLFEEYFQLYPEQWRFTGLLSNYFSDPG